MIEVVKFLSNPMGENAYIFFLEGEKRAVAVDPSYNAQAMLNYLKEEETQLEAILLTHGHFDHIAGVDVLREATGTPVYIHEADAQMLEDPEKNLSVITHRLFTIKPADRLLKGCWSWPVCRFRCCIRRGIRRAAYAIWQRMFFFRGIRSFP